MFSRSVEHLPLLPGEEQQGTTEPCIDIQTLQPLHGFSSHVTTRAASTMIMSVPTRHPSLHSFVRLLPLAPSPHQRNGGLLLAFRYNIEVRLCAQSFALYRNKRNTKVARDNERAPEQVFLGEATGTTLLALERVCIESLVLELPNYCCTVPQRLQAGHITIPKTTNCAARG